MKQYRLLRASEIECRVSRCTEKGVEILLYKTARTDADLLDETVGAENWENDFKIVDGVLYGGLGVNYGSGLVWKWDAGTESTTEAEKGRASDAFKRAGFKHGIGRELYSAPFIWISADKCNIKTGKNGKPACYDTFSVDDISYVGEKIDGLSISVNGRPAWSNGRNPDPWAEQKTIDDIPFVCAECGTMLSPVAYNGREYTIKDVDRISRKKFGKCVCWACMSGNENAG